MAKNSHPKATQSLEQKAVVHPGQYVREKALKPANMSVTEAATLIGVSRPNVSNFLNGKVAATSEMAARIERAFKIPAQTLLDMQALYDAQQAKGKGTPSNARAYVPPFLAIKANAIETWASSNISARTRLAVFLRTLVHSTGAGLTKVDFPGNDDAERPGWDGVVESSEGTPWIPKGLSGWEFGVTENVKGKADKDFDKSVKASSKEEREKTTFIFVTPRHWSGKKAWEMAAKAKGHWQDVRVYDAADIEQWVEQSLAAQTWFANETLTPSDHVRSLDRCWDDWAKVTNPPLTGALFNTAIEASKRTFLSWLSKSPDRPFIIAADSTEEALAFVSQALSERGGDELAVFRDRALVFDKPGVFPRLAQGAQTFIPIALTGEIERELAPYVHTMHCIIICSRNTANADPSITLDPVPNEAFRKALEEMKKNSDDVKRLSNESGCSLTVLRRRLSSVPAIQTPTWAADHAIAKGLVPFLLIGAWNNDNATDREGLSLIADRPYEKLEKECQRLTQLDDAPMWSVGRFRGVISKIDLLFAIAGSVTKEDLKRYFSLAQMVLGEDDPTLDIPDEERWAASIHGKVREFSSAFRNGVSETLVLLAVYGNAFFKNRLGIDTEMEAQKVIRDLLPSPLTSRVLEANTHDLPIYAEAAPDVFLSIIETDLKTENPAALSLMKPTDGGIFGSRSSRTGLLWALENLSWNPKTLSRAALILARLAQVEIKDNLVNKPMHSLETILSSWMPQTAAGHQERVNVVKKLIDHFPDVAWKLCVSQFGNNQSFSSGSHKPKWRPDGYGFGEPISTWGPIIEFQREIVELTLSWKKYNLNMLHDLVSRLDVLDDMHQARVWALIKAWADTATDAEKAALREKLRVTTLSQRAARRAKKKNSTVVLSQAAKDAYASLEPTDLLNKHAWLFQDTWVEESYDEIHEDEEIDFRKREERVATLRTEALKEILKQRGNEGILSIAERGKASYPIGTLLVDKKLIEKNSLVKFLQEALSSILAGNDSAPSRKNMIAGVLQALSIEQREAIIMQVSSGLVEKDFVQLLLLAPLCRSTWAMVDRLKEEAQGQYWESIFPNWVSDTERTEAIERLMKAGRPRAAFSLARLYTKETDARLLFQMLLDIAKGGKDQPGHYLLEDYAISQAFQHIDNGSGFTLEEKASLELAYIDVLARLYGDKHHRGIPNLEKYLEKHPELFVQAVVWTYKRKDGGTDPDEFRVAPENVDHMAKRGYKLLEGFERIPGYNDAGELDSSKLMQWIKTVRDACATLGRGDIGDLCIGKFLASAPEGADGVWPCEAVRDVMEELHSEHIMSGTHTSLYNFRGVHARGEGGAQERELADKYRKWAVALQITHPYVSSELLMGMVKTYEHEASQHDMEAGIRRRLQ